MTETAAAPKPGSIVVRAIASGLFIAFIGVAPWVALARLNARIHPELPWAALTTAAWLLLLLSWLNGAGWPRSTSGVRRSYLRLWRPPPGAWSGRKLAINLGLMGAVIALTILWIALSPARSGVDLDSYPTTAFRVSVFVMGAIVSGVAEEIAFRGYMQSQLERIGPTFAIMLTSIVFVLSHINHGVAALLVIAPGYFLASVIYGELAIRSGSILPGMMLHVLGDAAHTFVVVLGGDATRLLAQ